MLVFEQKISAVFPFKIFEQIQRDITISVQRMNQVIEEVREGLAIADNTYASFNKIIQSVKLVSSQIDQMAAATQKNSARSQQVTASFEGLLSADNALVLAVIAKHLPESQKRRAINHGIILAYSRENCFS